MLLNEILGLSKFAAGSWKTAAKVFAATDKLIPISFQYAQNMLQPFVPFGVTKVLGLNLDNASIISCCMAYSCKICETNTVTTLCH